MTSLHQNNATVIDQVHVICDAAKLGDMVDKVLREATVLTVRGYEHSLRSYQAYQCLLVLCARMANKWTCYVLDALALNKAASGFLDAHLGKILAR